MPVPAKTTDDILIDLFRHAVRYADGCLVSHLATNKKGYVPLSVGGRKGKKLRAHRFVFEELNGPLPPEVLVRHSCDKRNCIEPFHLEAGTPAQNSADMVQRDRQRNQYTVLELGYAETI